MSKTVLVIGVLAAILLTGCQKAPIEQVAAVQKALADARTAEADKYATEEFALAQESFDKAAAEIKVQDEAFSLTRSYSNANQQLTSALAQLQTAQTAAVENKEKVKIEVEALSTETESSIEAAKSALLKAPRGKDTKAELEAMKADLDATTTTLAEARELIAKGDYLGARTSLTQSKQKATEVSNEIEAAMHKVAAAKRPGAAR